MSPPTTMFDLAQQRSTSRTRSNKVKHGRTRSNTVENVRPCSTLINRDRWFLTVFDQSIVVEQRTLLWGDLFKEFLKYISNNRHLCFYHMWGSDFTLKWFFVRSFDTYFECCFVEQQSDHLDFILSRKFSIICISLFLSMVSNVVDMSIPTMLS